jgi:hypothetical protein
MDNDYITLTQTCGIHMFYTSASCCHATANSVTVGKTCCEGYEYWDEYETTTVRLQGGANDIGRYDGSASG